jgi:flagellar biogenesis protein FliO
MLLTWPALGLAKSKGRPAVAPPSSQAGEAEDRGQSVHAGTQPTEGAPVPEYQFAGPEQERSLLWDGVRMALSLALVLLVLGVGAKVVRRWPGFAARETPAGPLQVLGRLPLTAKEAVCLVRAGGEILVVGVSPAGVSLLHRLEGGAETMRAGATPPGARAAGWGEPSSGSRLGELMRRMRDVQAAWGISAPDPRGKS